VLKNFKEKKAASLMMILWYSIILFWLSSLLISMLISSERFVWISEKYNMAIYWAESWIEQALFEMNIHDIWFNDSTELPDKDWTAKQQNWVDLVNWFLSLNWNRLKYKWWVKWLNENGSESWYLVWKWNLKYISDSDSNKKFYKNFRKFFLYKDIWLILQDNEIKDVCNDDDFNIQLSVTWSNIKSEDNKINIVQWRSNAKDWSWSLSANSSYTNNNWDWTWFYIESNSTCWNSSNTKDPFCYSDKFNHTFWLFKWLSSSTPNSETIWKCLSEAWDDCDDQSLYNFLSTNDILKNFPFKPELIFSYQNKLFEDWDEITWLPIKYEVSWCSQKLPSLVQEIESTSQTYWSVQKITTKIYQWNQGIDLSYTVIQ